MGYGALLLALLLSGPPTKAPAALPQSGPPLGRGIKVGNDTLEPEAFFVPIQSDTPEPGLYRRIAVAWSRPPAGARYPAAAFAARQGGEVLVSLTVGPDGTPTACRITRPSGIAAFDQLSCRIALRGTGFYPGLDDQGRRFGGTVEGKVTFTPNLVQTVSMATAPFGADTPLRYPKPLQPITLDTLGIAPEGKRPQDYGLRWAILAIDAEGSVTACLLTSPTFDDSLDKRACDRLREQRFEPALDRNHRPVASRYEVYLPALA